VPTQPRRPLPPELQQSAFTLGQGRAAGLGDKRLRGGDLERPFRGVRVARTARPWEPALDSLPQPPAELVDRCAALLAVLGDRTVFSHRTAARLWPVPLPSPEPTEEVDVAVRPPGRPPRRRGVNGHELIDRQVQVVRRHGLPVVDPGSMFCQLGCVLDLADLVAVGDGLVMRPWYPHPYDDRPWLSLAALSGRVADFHGRGKVRAGQALGLIRPGVESRRETLLRLAILDAGLPEPEVNPELFAPDGTFLGRADLVYRRWWVIVEYDGDQHRTSTRQFDRDSRRLDDFAANGWRVVRITGRSFSTDPAGCAARVRRALLTAGWRPDSNRAATSSPSTTG
jgi:Protein of unknown function (DUF559)